MKSRLFIFAAGIALCSILSAAPGLAGASTPTRTPNPSATLNWIESNAGPFTTWDPANSTSTTAEWAMRATYDWLLQPNVNGRSLVPDLATAYKWNKKNTVLTFTLRHGVTFQDGGAFTASVAAQNVLRLQAGFGKSNLATMTAVTATSPYTLQLNFSAPNPGIIYFFTSMYAAIVSPTGMANPTSLVTTPAGSGPYQFAGLNASYTYTFNRWAGYWDKSHVYPAQIIVQNIPTEATRVNALLTGATNGTYVSGIGFPTVANNPNVQVAKIPTLSTFDVIMNDQIAPLNNLNVRKAISMAVDIKAMKAANDGLCIPGIGSVYGKGMTGYTPAIHDTYNPTKATQLIQKAGATGATVRMVTYQGLQPFNIFGQILVSELDAIGLNAVLVPVATALVRPSFAGGTYGIWVAQQATTSPDPTGITSWLSYPGYPTSVSPNIISLENTASQLPIGSAARQAAWVKVNRYITLTSPLVVALCQTYTIMIASKSVMGLYTMPLAAFTTNGSVQDLDIAKS